MILGSVGACASAGRPDLLKIPGGESALVGNWARVDRPAGAPDESKRSDTRILLGDAQVGRHLQPVNKRSGLPARGALVQIARQMPCFQTAS